LEKNIGWVDQHFRSTSIELVHDLAHITPEEFENGVFTLKTHQMFSVHTTPAEFQNAIITGHFGFVVEEKLAKKITLLS